MSAMSPKDDLAPLAIAPSSRAIAGPQVLMSTGAF
jgi:hypothetical protein